MSITAGALIGAGASHIEGWINRHYNAKEARAADARARDLWLYQTTEGPKLERQGLEAAGYNPMLAITGGLSSPSIPSAHAGSMSSIPDIAGSARQGEEVAKDIEAIWDEQKDQAETKTEADKKSLGVIDATKDKIKAETDAIKSQEFRNWVSSVGGLIGDGSQALLLWNLVKNNIKKGIFGNSSASIPTPIGGPRAGGSTARNVVPLLQGAAKYGVPALGLGLGATGIYYGLNNGLERDSPKKSGFYKRDEDRKSQGGYYPHGNWSR